MLLSMLFKPGNLVHNFSELLLVISGQLGPDAADVGIMSAHRAEQVHFGNVTSPLVFDGVVAAPKLRSADRTS